MTREEATKIFRKEIECLSHTKCSDCILEKVCDPINTTPLDSEYIEAFSMAIEALSAEPCDDCISRADALDAIATEKVGKWQFVQRGNFIDVCCAECGYTRVKEYAYGCKLYDLKENELDNLLSNSNMRFCENCGARMEGGAND